MSACLGKMIIEEEGVELAPQLKKMKISSEIPEFISINRPNYFKANSHKEMKYVFPYINDEVIINFKFRKSTK